MTAPSTAFPNGLVTVTGNLQLSATVAQSLHNDWAGSVEGAEVRLAFEKHKVDYSLNAPHSGHWRVDDWHAFVVLPKANEKAFFNEIRSVPGITSAISNGGSMTGFHNPQGGKLINAQP